MLSKLISSFLNNTKASDDEKHAVMANIVFIIGGDIVGLVLALGDALVSESEDMRSNALELLAGVITRLPVMKIDDGALETLIGFFMARIQDRASAMHSLSTLVFLCETYSVPDTMVAGIIESVVFNSALSSLPQAARKAGFELILMFIKHPLVSSDHDLAQLLISGFVDVMDGEKDPRNLFVCFTIIHDIAIFLSEHVEGMEALLFDSVSCYFPIALKHHVKDLNNTVNIDELRTKLHNALSLPLFGSLLVPFLSDKIGSPMPETKLASMQLIENALLVMNIQIVDSFAPTIWNLIYDEVMMGTDDDVILASLHLLMILIRVQSKDLFSIILKKISSNVKADDNAVVSAVVDTKIARLHARIFVAVASANDQYASSVLSIIWPSITSSLNGRPGKALSNSQIIWIEIIASIAEVAFESNTALTTGVFTLYESEIIDILSPLMMTNVISDDLVFLVFSLLCNVATLNQSPGKNDSFIDFISMYLMSKLENGSSLFFTNIASSLTNSFSSSSQLVHALCTRLIPKLLDKLLDELVASVVLQFLASIAKLPGVINQSVNTIKSTLLSAIESNFDLFYCTCNCLKDMVLCNPDECYLIFTAVGVATFNSLLPLTNVSLDSVIELFKAFSMNGSVELRAKLISLIFSSNFDNKSLYLRSSLGSAILTPLSLDDALNAGMQPPVDIILTLLGTLATPSTPFRVVHSSIWLLSLLLSFSPNLIESIKTNVLALPPMCSMLSIAAILRVSSVQSLEFHSVLINHLFALMLPDPPCLEHHLRVDWTPPADSIAVFEILFNSSTILPSSSSFRKPLFDLVFPRLDVIIESNNHDLFISCMMVCVAGLMEEDCTLDNDTYRLIMRHACLALKLDSVTTLTYSLSMIKKFSTKKISAFAEYFTELVSALLYLANKHSETSIRLHAVECIDESLSFISLSHLIRHKDMLLASLSETLDDPKRIVRNQARITINKLYIIFTQ